MSTSISRRSFLMRTGAVGCSLAASPLVTPVSFAAMPGENRLVVIILRGGMDGLDVVQPYGDAILAQSRPALKVGPTSGALDLDGYFALHPSLNALMPLWDAGELGFVHAVSTPYRDKRSHFDGQDLLEAGTTTLGGRRGRRLVKQIASGLSNVRCAHRFRNWPKGFKAFGRACASGELVP